MNRKGSLEWNLETVGKLVFAILILAAIVYMSYKLIGLFVGGETDYRAQRNFDLLTNRVQYAIDNKVDTSVILEEPVNYAIIGFDTKQDDITFVSDSKWGVGYDLGGQKIIHPDSCSKDQACICAVKLSVSYNQKLFYTDAMLAPKFIACKNVAATMVMGNIEKTEIRRPGINIVVHPEKVNSHSPLFLVAPDPINVYIQLKGGVLIGDMAFQPGGGKFGGSGATGSY